MSLEQKEFSLIFSEEQSKFESFLEELIQNKDAKFSLYFPIFIQKYGQNNPNKITSIFEKYSENNDNINSSVLYNFLNFILANSIIIEKTPELIKKYIQIEEDYDLLQMIVKKSINLQISSKDLTEILLSFYEKIKNFDFKDIYLKEIIQVLKKNNRLIETEALLTTIHKDIKAYWVVENLVEIYTHKEEYENILNIFIGLITGSDFAKLWAETLGIIDKAIEKILNKEEIIDKIIPHLKNINILIDKSPKNVLKIYNSIADYLDKLNENEQKEFISAFYNFLEITNDLTKSQENGKPLSTEELIGLMTKIVEKTQNQDIIRKIGEITKTENIISQIINKLLQAPEKISNLIDIFISNYNLIHKDAIISLLNTLSLDEWIRIYDKDANFLKHIRSFGEDITYLNHNAIDNLINALLIKKQFELSLEITKIFVESLLAKNKNIDELNISMSLFSQISINLVLENYLFVFYNIGKILNYPDFIWFVYNKLREKIRLEDLKRIFLGIFIFYMDVEEDIDEQILDNFKNEILSMIKSG